MIETIDYCFLQGPRRTCEVERDEGTTGVRFEERSQSKLRKS